MTATGELLVMSLLQAGVKGLVHAQPPVLSELLTKVGRKERRYDESKSRESSFVGKITVHGIFEPQDLISGAMGGKNLLNAFPADHSIFKPNNMMVNAPYNFVIGAKAEGEYQEHNVRCG